MLIAETIFTMADFVVEDRTRYLPAFERVLHTVLTLLFGVVLMALAPVLIDWLGQPTDVVATEHGAFSALFTVLAAGMIVFGIRDGIAALGHIIRFNLFPPPAQRRAEVFPAGVDSSMAAGVDRNTADSRGPV